LRAPPSRLFPGKDTSTVPFFLLLLCVTACVKHAKGGTIKEKRWFDQGEVTRTAGAANSNWKKQGGMSKIAQPERDFVT
jgi:hypothetical protein